MTETQTGADPRATAKAQIIDALRRRLSFTEATAAVGVSRRTGYGWRNDDPKFDDACREAVEDAGNLISRKQVADWRAELAQLDDEMSGIETALGDVAAPAHAGCPESIARRDDLRAQHQAAQEAAAALRQAIASGELHVARQDQERAERERQAAAAEAADLGAQQRAAAERIDAALAEIEREWSQFVALAQQRQSAARRSGSNARAAYQAQLVAAVFAVAPSITTALGIDRRYRTSARPLKDVVS